MSVRIDVDPRVARELRQFAKDMPKHVREALLEAGRFVQSTARKWTPQSPTKSQSNAYSGPSKSRFHPGRAPGALRNSIKIRKGNDFVDIGVFSGAALLYADYIHNRRHKVIRGWEFLGPGNTQFRAQKGDKFLDRALEHHGKDIEELFTDMTEDL
ncbi:MAG: HK97 gp10 family phage protein [Gammaproteobacteria bacterium]|nr:HK97 gp10 family phage protein [Gammaproteobacteria bacterium]